MNIYTLAVIPFLMALFYGLLVVNAELRREDLEEDK
jgi:hypothetical protein